MRGLVGGVVLGLCLVCSAGVSAQDKWGASIDSEVKVGNKRSLGEADAFVPLWQDNETLLFGNARYRFDDSNSKEGNYGLALRHMLGDWNLGGYGYFDRRATERESLFSQLTFGAEALGADFDLRVNSYWPVGETSRNVDSLNSASISGTSVVFRGGEERAFQGFDAELGWRVPLFDYDGPFDLRVYGGGYHFYDPDNAAPDVTGPRLRAEFTAYELQHLPKGARVTVGAEWQDDDARGSQGFASLRVRIPLQSEAQRNRQLTAQERRMTTPIVRDVDIVAQGGAFGAAETATTANGGTLAAFSSDNTGGAALANAINAAGNNTTILLSGTFDISGTSITPQTGQTLMAGTITVRSPSGRTANLTTSATVTSSAGSTNVVNVTNQNITLTGLTVITTGSNSTGIDITENNAVISNNRITGTTNGLNISGATNVTVSGNTLSANTALNLTSGGGAVSVTVAGNTLNGTSNHTATTIAGNPITINAGSTGNVRVSGACLHIGGAATGSISFTSGATC